MARTATEIAVDLVFPRRCGLCGSFGRFLCGPCGAALPVAPMAMRCPTCARWLDTGAPCGRCAALTEPTLDSLTPVFSFEDGARRLVHRLKYERLSALAEPMGARMAESAAQLGVEVDVIVPVPLHPSRQRDRGFNQAALLARQVSRRIEVPVHSRALMRSRRTDAQARTGSSATRAANVAGAFTCRTSFAGSNVLLIDDVATTGATLRACAVALRAAGAASVHALVFAHEE
jgi:ComF family protein